ncbi:MAG: twin-arginine translocation signal domain-containing protein [Aggregatilineales bacterium]
MFHLSRRDFLRAAGLGLAAAVVKLPSFSRSEQGVLYGRALAAASVINRSSSARAVTHLWPDSIVRIFGRSAALFQIADGFVPVTALQPMVLATEPAPPLTKFPVIAEVAGAVAAVRGYCAPEAPLVARIGHGGTAKLLDWLNTPDGGWYAVADDKDAYLGWTPAVHWRAAEPAVPHQTGDIVIDLRQHVAQAVDLAGEVIFTAPLAAREAASTGTFTVRKRDVSLCTGNNHTKKRYGIPWALTLSNEMVLAGAYWHNHFAIEPALDGPTFQVAPAAAKFFYSWVGPQNAIVIA